MPTWENWLRSFPGFRSFADVLELPPKVREQTWEPSAADRKQAWELFTELRTRITTQPLHYTEGDEPAALKSVADLFAVSRELIRKGGPEARHFATLVTFFLNKVVRPFTAKWHKDSLKGNLANEDVRHEFREKLTDLQDKVRLFGTVLGRLAEGDEKFAEGSESWPPPKERAAERPIDLGLGEDIPFDRVLFDGTVPEEVRGKVLSLESAEVRARRTAVPQPTDIATLENAELQRSRSAGQAPEDEVLHNLTGLAISGGGLRSATFALGVVQAMAEKNMLGQFDLLSTVSGGGYLGSFLSSYLNSPQDPRQEISPSPGPRHPDVGPNRDQFPFKKPPVGESTALRHLRSQSKFLLNGGALGRFRMMLQALFGMLTNAAIVFPWIAIAVLVAGSLEGKIRDAVFRDEYNYLSDVFSHGNQIIVSGGFVVLLMILPIVLRLARRQSLAKLGSTYLLITSGWFALFLAVTAWNSIPALFRIAEHIGLFFSGTNWLPDMLKSEWMALASPAALHAMGRIVAVAGRQKPWTVALKKLITRVAGPLFLLAVFVLLGRAVILNGGYIALEFTLLHRQWDFTPSELLIAVTVGLLIYDHLFLDINLSSLHPFYRARLSEAYLRQHAVNRPDEITHADHTRLSELRRSPDSRAPYHLLNAALNSPAGTHPALRGRHCDFFLFSKHVCGSASTGYWPTTEFEKRDPALNLGTAMAISGAAASPFMGTGSGETSFLLAMFNIRLDYWLRFPGRTEIPLFSWKPGPWYLGRHLLGRVHEQLNFINLSDGGHIENLAIYELLRRRCKFIVAVDGECDPMITTGSLMTLMNYAKIDFGIEIKFAYAGGLDRLKPSSIHTTSLTEKHANAASEPKASEASDSRATQVTPVLRSPMLPYHFALARIEYPAETPNGPKLLGWLLYLKSSLTGNEGPTISHYRSRYPAFPHESTSDLFYDEEQFEAYRALGQHIADDVFRTEITGQPQAPNSIRGWFEHLKDKMTNPNAL